MEDNEFEDEDEGDDEGVEKEEILLTVRRRLVWITAICMRVTNIKETTKSSNNIDGRRRKNLLTVRRSKGFTGGTGMGIKWYERLDVMTIVTVMMRIDQY